MTVPVVNTTGSYRLVVPGEPWRTGALVLVPLVDEWTQSPPADVTARSLTPHTAAHVTAGTLVLTGLPERAFPTLATAPAQVVAELRRDGRVPQVVTVTVPTGTVTPWTAPPVAVTARTVRLSGRVTAAAFPHGPVAGAQVTFAGAAAALVTVPVPLALDHAAGTTIRARTLTPAAATSLDAPSRAGQRVLTVASTAGIAAGTVLAVGEDLVVADGTNGPLVLLRTPVAASAAASSPVTPHTLGAAGAAAQLSRAALAGDGLLPASGTLAAAVVEVVDGAATEYRRTALATDADGRWALPGVRGIPEVDLTVTAAGFLTEGPRRYPLAPLDPFVLNTSLRT